MSFGLACAAGAASLAAVLVVMCAPRLETPSELDAILSLGAARGKHSASVVIFELLHRGSAEPAYFFERKTVDYPLADFAGALALIGGNVEVRAWQAAAAAPTVV